MLRLISRWLVQCSPETCERLARQLGFVLFRVFRIRHRLMVRNLGIAFPDKTVQERKALAQESLSQFLMTVFEFLRASAIDPVPGVEVEGAENLTGALAHGQGAYILCFHLGNWEVMGATMTRLIAPSYVVVKKVGFSSLDRFVSRVRETIGFLTVKRQKRGDGFKRIVEILDQGEVVGFVMDQARPGEPKLPFFNHPAKTNTSFAAIYQKKPAPVIPGYIIRKSFERHRLVFCPPVVLQTTEDPKQDVINHSILFNKVVEDAVKQAPQCYFWMHNRWK